MGTEASLSSPSALAEAALSRTRAGSDICQPLITLLEASAHPSPSPTAPTAKVKVGLSTGLAKTQRTGPWSPGEESLQNACSIPSFKPQNTKLVPAITMKHNTVVPGGASPRGTAVNGAEKSCREAPPGTRSSGLGPGPGGVFSDEHRHHHCVPKHTSLLSLPN